MGLLNDYQMRYRRRHWIKRNLSQELLTLWNESPISAAQTSRLLAVDLETTGLDIATVRIVSFGWVQIDNSRILLRSARHVLVQLDSPMNQSAAIHGLVDADLKHGIPLVEAMQEFVKAAAGCTLLVHGAKLDIGLLDRVSRELFGAPLLMPYLDTLDMARRQLVHRDQVVKQGGLRLPALRKTHGLPPISNHHALTDAIATAELYLAMR